MVVLRKRGLYINDMAIGLRETELLAKTNFVRFQDKPIYILL